MLRSSNPILTRKEAFAPAQPQGYAGYGQAGYGQPGGYPGYAGGQGAYPGYGQQPYTPQPYQPQPTGRGLMTLDDVMVKTGILFVVMMACAAALFFGGRVGLVPILAVYGIAAVAGIAGAIMSFVVAFKRHVSPALTVVFAVLEGLFVGGISLLFEAVYPGIVVQAVFGTFCAAVAVFAAYKFLRIRVSGTMMRVVLAAGMGFFVVALAGFVLNLFGVSLGLYPAPGQPASLLAWVFAIVGLALAAFNLIIDFQWIDGAIRRGTDASESWRAAYGLLGTMVFLYIQILRILSYIRR